MDIKRIHPAGDPFTSAPRRDHEVGLAEHDHPHGCYSGLVYLGHLEMTEEGEEVEVIEAVPCRRFAESV